MQRIAKGTEGQPVEVWYVTLTAGAWGATSFPPEEEAQHLKHYYVERKGYTFPIALWAGPKEKNEDGGMTPRGSPTWEQFPIRATPTFVVVDGKGIVRHISVGYSRRIEEMFKANLQYLVNETRQANNGNAATSPVKSAGK